MQVQYAEMGNRDRFALENPAIANRNDEVRLEPFQRSEPGWRIGLRRSTIFNGISLQSTVTGV
ncbi:MAG: hypothetical protein P8Y61_14075 [Gammaproteobacteria bacterium]